MDTADRFEYKFLLSTAARAELLHRLEGRLLPDTLGGSDGRYPIVSLYYDSPDLRCFWDNWRGVPSHRKLRVRAYGTLDGAIPPTSFIEVKHKADGRGVKRRVQTTLANALALVAGAGDDAGLGLPELRLLAEARQLVEGDGFRPSCVMRYDRHAYFLRLPGQADDAALRVTFDQAIRVRFDELTPATDDRRFDRDILPPDRCIMEVKGSGAVPYLFADHLTQLRLAPRNFSKYSEAIRLGGRHLPAVA